MNKTLTPKQQAFVDEYLVDLNATQAAIRAGYSAKHAESQAYQLLQKTPVQQAIQKAKQARSEKTGIDANFVLLKTVEYLAKCNGEMPIPKAGKDEDGRPITIMTQEFNPTGVGKALELLGKHVDIGAFKERTEVTGTIMSHEEWLRSLK